MTCDISMRELKAKANAINHNKTGNMIWLWECSDLSNAELVDGL